MNFEARKATYSSAMPLDVPSEVPADTLFPTWRGRAPYRRRLQEVTDKLLGGHSGLGEALATLPFDRFEACWHSDAPVQKYNDVPQAAARFLGSLPEELRAPWLCALILWQIGRFEERFPNTGLHSEFALHYVDTFHRLLDQVADDPAFATLSSDSFLKDLWLARLVMIPAFAQVWWPRSGIELKPVLRSSPAAAAYVFLRCGGRKPMMEGHTHDPVAKAYWNEKGWGEALRLAALALPALPQLRGVFGTAWFYDPALKEVTPRLSFAQDLQVGRGAHRIRIGSNEAAIPIATATSAARRSLYEEAKYLPTDYAVIWSKRDLAAAYGA